MYNLPALVLSYVKRLRRKNNFLNCSKPITDTVAGVNVADMYI